jgi:ketosteroid isomerase-like protein
MSSPGAQVVERYIEIMNKLDIDALGEIFTDDVVVRLPFAPDPVPKVTEGKEAVVALYGGFPHLVGPLGFHDLVISPLAAEGEFVAQYRSDTTMLSTGEPYRNSYISTFTVRDGSWRPSPSSSTRSCSCRRRAPRSPAPDRPTRERRSRSHLLGGSAVRRPVDPQWKGHPMTLAADSPVRSFARRTSRR